MPDVHGRVVFCDRVREDLLALVPHAQVLHVHFDVGGIAAAIAGLHHQFLLVGVEAVVEHFPVDLVAAERVLRRNPISFVVEVAVLDCAVGGGEVSARMPKMKAKGNRNPMDVMRGFTD